MQLADDSTRVSSPRCMAGFMHSIHVLLYRIVRQSNTTGGNSKTTMDNQPQQSGLWKRQSSLVEEGKAGSPHKTGDNNDVSMEIDDNVSSGGGSGTSGVSLLSAPDGAPASGSHADSSSLDPISADNLSCFVYGHIALSFLFLVAGSSIVPTFAAAENESWRSNNIPYQKTASGDVILDFLLNKPLVDPPTVPSGMLIYSTIVFPLLFVALVNLCNTWGCKFVRPVRIQQQHELRASVCGLLISIGLSEAVTQVLKLYVSRHRPNFYNLCGFDKKTLQCTAPLSKVHEASLSFPSGHSSLSFCSMTYLAFFLAGRLGRITPSMAISLAGRIIRILPYKPILVALAWLGPWSYSVYVATSRIVDNWHHPSDVIAGTLLGITMAIIGYHAFYPSANSANAGIPLSLHYQQQLTATST